MIRASLVLYLLCASAVTHAGPAKSAHLLRWSTQSVATTGPKADDARLNLAHALTERGFPITAARLYVDILSARQSPSMTQQAETALEHLIWTHEFSPYWLTLGVLGKGDDAHTTATDSGVVAYLNAERVRREGHDAWADKAQQHWTQNVGWHNWSRIQEAHRALSHGDTQTATEALGAVNQPIDPALQTSLHAARVHLAWQQDDVAGVLFLLAQTSPTSTLPVEETLQRGWAYFKRGASGKAIGAARQVLRQDTTLFRQVEAAKLEGMVWLDTCQPNRVDAALNPVQKELEATIDAIAQGAHPHTLPNVREWMSHDSEFGALFALTAAARHEQSGLAALGLQLPGVERYIDLLEQHASAHQTEVAWRVTQHMNDMLGELLWMRQQQSFSVRGGARPAWSPDAPTRTFATIPQTKIQRALYLFDDEEWTDEQHHLTVLGSDQCLAQ